MAEYTTISTAKANKKGNIIVKVVSLGELSSGNSKDGSTWQKQTAVIKDNSGSQNLILWNDDIGKVEQGKYYFIENPYWTEYKGETQLSLGKFCKLSYATTLDLIGLDSVQSEQSTLGDHKAKESLKMTGNTITDFDPEHFTLTGEEMEKLYNDVDHEMSYMIPAHHRVLANIKLAGIENPHPSLVGMFFNNYIKKRLQK